jgi:stearoyl-CoA desaturase (delta-9 desaturase)
MNTPEIPGVVFGGRAAVRKRIDNAILLAVPTLGTAAAILHAAGSGISLATVAVFAAFYLWTAFGATLGLHRYFTHRSFRASPAVAFCLGVGACFTMQGSIIRWVADHRRHHRLEDRAGDPHSPCVTAGGKRLSPVAGFLHAYFGWMFDASVTDTRHFFAEAYDDRLLLHFHRWYWIYVAGSLAMPAVAGWALGGATEAVRCLLWAGCVRVFVIQQAAFTVNSLGHAIGPQDFSTRDSSRNLWPFSILLLGDGYHNNHHAFPRSARIALLPGQIDPGHAVLRWLERMGLVSHIIVPSPASIAARRKHHEPARDQPGPRTAAGSGPGPAPSRQHWSQVGTIGAPLSAIIRRHSRVSR